MKTFICILQTLLLGSPSTGINLSNFESWGMDNHQNKYMVSILNDSIATVLAKFLTGVLIRTESVFLLETFSTMYVAPVYDSV